MANGRRVSLLGLLGLGLTLVAAGCQLQISFMEPTPKPVAQPAQPQEQVAAAPPGPLRLASNQMPANNRNAPQMPPAHLQHPENYPGQPIPPGHAAPSEYAPEAAMHTAAHLPPTGYVPTEKAKTSLPPYVIEPPDILLLDPIRLVPKPPYVVAALDVLIIRVGEPLANQPIEGPYTVSPDGTVNLGYSYGQVRVAGLSIEDVERAIRTQLGRVLKEPQVSVTLTQFRGVQQTRGEHLVRPDGTINLGSYGCVYVAGLTLGQAKVAVERHLCQYLQEPEVSVDVFAYNSKVYYVITDGAGYGMQVYRFPVTGNETVLDAISNIQGLPAVASKKKIWVARPAPPHHPCSQVLPVDWVAITEGGVTTTNYQIFPGDRIYVQSNCLIRFDNVLAQILSPFERLLGFTFLGASTYQTFVNANAGGGIGFVAPLR